MRVEVAAHAGFCSGVKAAVDKALDLAEKYGRIYTLGELVHNELVTEFLQSNGIYNVELDNLCGLKSGDVVLIRAHGVPESVETDLRNRGLIVEDATCPVVKRNQRLARERAELGDNIVIIGDSAHDEVIGISGYARDKATIVPIGQEPQISDGPTSVIFQTTVLEDDFNKIKDFVLKFQKNSCKSVGIFNTICYNTTVRQQEVRELAKATDAVLVLGAKHSANTRRLAEVASEFNSNVIFANSVDEVKSCICQSKDIQSVSIVAGASTPPWLIREVNKLMSETTQIVAENSAEVEVNKEATLQEQPTTTQDKETETMADLLKSTNVAGNYTNYRVGKRIKGTVISAGESGIYVAIGGKKDGFIDKSDASIDGNYNPSDFNKDDVIFANIKSVDKDYVKLSKKEVDAERIAEEEAEKALSAGEFSLVMTEVVKDGLRGRMGQYTVFVPASQIRIGYVNNLEDYKGKKLRLMIMPPKTKVAEVQEGEENTENKPEEAAKPHRKKYLVASQRMILEKEKKEKEDAFWGKMHVNDIVTGKVKRFTQFGAFVSVDGFDCLAHISELSWNRITDPSTVLKIGDVKDFVVLKLDREAGRISLGYKQLQKKPYEVAAEKYPVGTVIKGKVERIFPYGAFVSIEDGIDGLVHVSQISHNWIKDANEALTAGQEVEAKIIGFEDTRITLSIKDLLPTPDETITAVAVEGEATEEEKASKRSSRMKKFEQKVADGEGRKDRRAAKKETSNEPKEWVSGSGSASLGELFKGLNLELADELEESAEAPKKKTTRKKKTENAE